MSVCPVFGFEGRRQNNNKRDCLSNIAQQDLFYFVVMGETVSDSTLAD